MVSCSPEKTEKDPDIEAPRPPGLGANGGLGTILPPAAPTAVIVADVAPVGTMHI
jgi:hypothetical protein